MIDARAKWDAAVELQHVIARLLALIPVGTPESDEEFARLVRQAQAALQEADRYDIASEDEFFVAWRIHRRQVFDRNRKESLWRAERSVDEQLNDRATAAQRIMRAVGAP